MKDRWCVERIAGVNVVLHWSLLLFGGLVVARLAGGRFPTDAPGHSRAQYGLAAAITTFVFLGCVLAHELGHAVVARREGIAVDGITLWFLGGVTGMSSEAATPGAELAVAGAGPLTSGALGVVMGGLAIAARARGVSPLVVESLQWLSVINLLVAGFNILPALPLDGGHLLHALAWSRHGDRQRATRTASRAGALLGTTLVALGLFAFVFRSTVGGGPWLVLVGWFLLAGARVEEADGNPGVAFEDSTPADATRRMAATLSRYMRNVLDVRASGGPAERTSERLDPGDADRILTTVLFTDIVASTERVAAVGDRRWRAILDAHDEAVRNELTRFGGTEIRTTGDGFLASFDGPARAIRCAQAITSTTANLGIELRAGLHTGECEWRGDDLAGLAVHIAARVGAIAGPSEVLVSNTVKELVAGSGIAFCERGEYELKGVPGLRRLFAAEP